MEKEIEATHHIVVVVVIVISAVSYNVAHKNPVIKFHEERTAQALLQESQEKVSLTRPVWRVKSHGFSYCFGLRFFLGLILGYLILPKLVIYAFVFFELAKT